MNEKKLSGHIPSWIGDSLVAHVCVHLGEGAATIVRHTQITVIDFVYVVHMRVSTNDGGTPKSCILMALFPSYTNKRSILYDNMMLYTPNACPKPWGFNFHSLVFMINL